jgi:hypothetical protein
MYSYNETWFPDRWWLYLTNNPDFNDKQLNNFLKALKSIWFRHHRNRISFESWIGHSI